MTFFDHRRWTNRSALLGAALVCIVSAPAGLAPAGSAHATPVSAPVSASSLQPDFDVRAEQWWLDILGAEIVWDRHSRGEGVVVAVIDDGVDPSGDLAGAVLPGFDHTGRGRGDIGEPTGYHGTTVATQIAGRGTGQGVLGVAPAATILPVRVPERESVDRTAEALLTLAAMDDPPEIVNMSYAEAIPCPQDVVDAVAVALDAGMILVGGMGNSRTGAELPNAPANCPGVIAVGAYGYFGPKNATTPDLRIWPQSEQQAYTTLAAPGVDMIGFAPGTDDALLFNGTSFAAAVTSGSLALVRGAFPDLPSRELVARVLATARPLDDSGPNQAWGYGAVRPLAAIEERVSPRAPNPLYDAAEAAAVADPGATPAPPTASAPDGQDTDPGTGSPSSPGSGAASEESSSGALVAAAAGGGLVVLLGVGGALLVSRRRRSTP